MNINDKPDLNAILRHRKKVANTAFRLGIVSTIANSLMVLCFIFRPLSEYLRGNSGLIVFVAMFTGLLAFMGGLSFKSTDKHLPDDEGLQEQGKSKAEFGILFGLLNLLLDFSLGIFLLGSL